MLSLLDVRHKIVPLTQELSGMYLSKWFYGSDTLRGESMCHEAPLPSVLCTRSGVEDAANGEVREDVVKARL